MSRAIDVVNALAFVAAITLASWGASVDSASPDPHVLTPPSPAGTTAPAQRAADGSRGLWDAQRTWVPLVPYRRIVSATLVADQVLADLAEPARIAAFTSYAARGQHAHRFADKPAIDARVGLERILALEPDLLLVSELFEPSYVARLREHGVAVFDLGPMAGLATLLRQIRTIGQLLGEPQRAAAYAEALARRMRAVAADGRALGRRRALYVGVYGGRLFGGARDTSYHDVITHAGLRDAAAEAGLVGWPELSAERVLAIDPDVIVTRTGMGALICRQPGLAQIDPCAGEGRIIELAPALLDDPGPGMLEATEALRAASVQR